MSEATYNPCLLHRYEPFGMIALQTNNTLILVKTTFVIMEKKATNTAKFITKERACLLPQTSMKFNGTWIQLM